RRYFLPWTRLRGAEYSLHSLRRVTGHRALVRIAALAQECHPQRVGLPVREQLRLAAADLEVVLKRTDVRDLEYHDAALRRLRAQRDLELFFGKVERCEQRHFLPGLRPRKLRALTRGTSSRDRRHGKRSRDEDR